MPVSLARQYAEQVDVVRRDDVPAQLRWRNRRYVVREVLDHWWIAGAWWDGRVGSGVDDECECWRVEAVPGHRGSALPTPAVVLEVCFAWSTGTWTVTRLFD